MGEQRHYLIDVTDVVAPTPPTGGGCGAAPHVCLSEFERAQVRRIAEEGSALAANVVRWHQTQSRAYGHLLQSQLSHGLAVAALGAVIMQILAWVRLVEPTDTPPATLRTAREVIEGADPEADPSALDTQARALLLHALDVKAKARRISRHW